MEFKFELFAFPPFPRGNYEFPVNLQITSAKEDGIEWENLEKAEVSGLWTFPSKKALKTNNFLIIIE